MKRREFLKLGIAGLLVAAGLVKAPPLPKPKPELTFADFLWDAVRKGPPRGAGSGGYLMPEEYAERLRTMKGPIVGNITITLGKS